MLDFDGLYLCTAIFPDTERRASDGAIHDETGGAAARVASDRVRGVGGVLVRAHQPDYLPCDMQEPPSLGISHQTAHQK